MSFITKGLTWFQNQRHTHCTVEVEIGLTDDTLQPINATISQDHDNSSTQNRLIQQKQVFHFIVKRSDLVSLGIKLQRGLKIRYSGDLYEVLYDNKSMAEYNDPHKLDMILKAVITEETDGLSPTYNPS